MSDIKYLISPPIDDAALNDLYAASTWPNYTTGTWRAELERCLLYVCAYSGDLLVGFLYVAWDGGIHGFLLEPTVRKAFQRQGIGTRLVQEAAEACRERELHWLHVDYASDLDGFYRGCGFQPTAAGVMRLKKG